MIYSHSLCKIHYEIHGEGLPVIALHGFGVDLNSQKGPIERALPEDAPFKRIYIDLPGMGKSKDDNVVQTADDMVTIIQDLIKDLDLDSYILAGFSYGGYIARHIFDHDPKAAGLFLTCPVVFQNQQDRELPPFKKCRRSKSKDLNPREKGLVRGFAVYETPQSIHNLISDIIPGLDAADQDFLEKFRATGYGFSGDNSPTKAMNERPVACLTGLHDAIVGYKDAEKMLNQYPNSTFLVLDAAGHNLPQEHPDVMKAHLCHFLHQFI